MDGKKLESNNFLVSWSVCFVTLLVISFIGMNVSIKQTYSTDSNCYMTENGEVCITTGENIVQGAYKFNFEQIKADATNAYAGETTSETVNFTANGRQFGSMYYDEKYLSEALYFSTTAYITNKERVYYRKSGSTWAFDNSWTEENSVINFTSAQTVSSTWYEWFIEYAEPVNQCYYNKDSNSFVWTNVDVGNVRTEYSTKSACNSAKAVVLMDSSGIITINNYSTPHYYFGTSSEEFSISNYYSTQSNYNVKRNGYTLSWNTKEDGTGTTYNHGTTWKLTSNLLLYAIWRPNEYSVTFDANGGTGNMSEQLFNFGVSQKLNANQFSKDGHVFKVWNTNSDGTGITYGNQQSISITNNMTLYAIWEKDTNPSVIINNYKVDENEMMVFTSMGIGQNDFSNNIVLDSGLYHTVDSKNVDGKDVLYTGGKVKIYFQNGGIYKEYTIVVLGDTNGDGELSTMDYINVYNHLDNSNPLSGVYVNAADMNNDDDITTMDYINIYNTLGGN